jgi:hypothetical protein
MNRHRHRLLLPLWLSSAVLTIAGLRAQDWTDAELVTAAANFQNDALPARLVQIGALLAEQKRAATALATRVHGDHREYQLRVDRLLGELADPRWQVREAAERTLVEIGSRARSEIELKRTKYDVLEQQIRCARILDALLAKGTEQEDRDKRLLRGLVMTALYMDPEPRLVRALRSATGHTDGTIATHAIRALGKHGGDDEAEALLPLLTGKNGSLRLATLAALARMRSPRALEACRQLLGVKPAAAELATVGPTPTEIMTIVRALHARDDDGAATLLTELGKHPDPVLAVAASTKVPAAGDGVKAKFTMPDRQQIDGGCGGFLGDAHVMRDAFPSLPTAELAFGECDQIDFPTHALVANTEARLFLNQGSMIAGKLIDIDAEAVQFESAWFGKLRLLRKDVQAIVLNPQLDRLVGASSDHDRARLTNGTWIDADVLRADATTLIAAGDGEGTQSVPRADLDGILFTRPRATEPDNTVYARFDLVTGERLIGFIGDSSSSHTVVTVPGLGAAVLPLLQVSRIELGVGGGATWGFTLIADYSDNRIVEVDEQGRVVFALEEIFGAWDAECLDNGNLLITEFAVSRVQEVDRKGKSVWAFEKLKNPYDADRLPNGNTLIADTFASRVIEVDKAGNIVWQYAKEVRPFDCDRLPNGNTLIADVVKDRVIEVSKDGEIVWEVKGMPNAHDADRLPNGNTLITLRNKGQVIEVDRDGNVVFELNGLSSPSDADRLPNGNTLVAENTRAREFDRRGNEVWRKEMTWAVEANRY